MRNIFLISIICVLACGCSTPKLTNSIWCTIDPLQNGDEVGLGITSLYLYENGNIDIYKSIMADSNLVVAPYLFAKGEYKIDGNLKKEAGITVKATNLKNQSFDWSGLIDLKKKSILIFEPENKANIYVQYSDLVIE